MKIPTPDLLLVLLFCAWPLPSLAQEAKVAEDVQAKNAQEADSLTKAEAKQWTFALKDGSALKLQPNSVLRWENPIDGELYGNVFLWTYQGRPEIIGSILKWYVPFTHMSTELHSLSADPLTGTYKGTRAWLPERGVQFQPIPEAPAPGQSAFQRLRQIRSIAKRFTAEMTDRNVPDEVFQLRLLSQPILRYSSPDRGILDGALLVFVKATDPEVWLLVEAHGDEESSQWQFALAQMDSVVMRVFLDKRKIWTTPQVTPPWSNVKDRKLPYTVFHDYD